MGGATRVPIRPSAALPSIADHFLLPATDRLLLRSLCPPAGVCVAEGRAAAGLVAHVREGLRHARGSRCAMRVRVCRTDKGDAEERDVGEGMGVHDG